MSQFQHSRVSVFQDLMLPTNVTATTSVAEAIAGARYAVHALPVQHSRAFLTSIKVRACLVPICRSTQLGTDGHTLLAYPPPPFSVTCPSQHTVLQIAISPAV